MFIVQEIRFKVSISLLATSVWVCFILRTLRYHFTVNHKLVYQLVCFYCRKAAPSQPSLLEIPKPTRFDWPEDECLPDVVISQTSVDSFEDLSYDTKVIVKPVYEPKPVILADSIEMMPVSPSVVRIMFIIKQENTHF